MNFSSLYAAATFPRTGFSRANGDVRLETARREQLELVPTNIDDLIAYALMRLFMLTS